MAMPVAVTALVILSVLLGNATADSETVVSAIGAPLRMRSDTVKGGKSAFDMTALAESGDDEELLTSALHTSTKNIFFLGPIVAAIIAATKAAAAAAAAKAAAATAAAIKTAIAVKTALTSKTAVGIYTAAVAGAAEGLTEAGVSKLMEKLRKKGWKKKGKSTVSKLSPKIFLPNLWD